jgi:hypothetical protein
MQDLFGPRSSATFDPDRPDLWRYRLWRALGGSGGRCLWIMLNPSTADAERNDPTIRKCLGFSARWGYGSLEVVNLFALRSTDPAGLRKVDDPIGPGNDAAILAAAGEASCIVAAWGNHGAYLERALVVRRILAAHGFRLQRLGELTDEGQPGHPLYVPYETPLQPLEVDR